MKKILIIMVASLMLMACPNPVSEEGNVEEVKNPFVGTWKNTVAESNRDNVGFTFKEDGTFIYWMDSFNLTGSGNYIFNDTHLIFNNYTQTWNGGTNNFTEVSQKYIWKDENHFHLYKVYGDPFGDGPYIKQ